MDLSAAKVHLLDEFISTTDGNLNHIICSTVIFASSFVVLAHIWSSVVAAILLLMFIPWSSKDSSSSSDQEFLFSLIMWYECVVYDLYVMNGHNGLYYSSHDAFVCIRSESRVE